MGFFKDNFAPMTEWTPGAWSLITPSSGPVSPDTGIYDPVLSLEAAQIESDIRIPAIWNLIGSPQDIDILAIFNLNNSYYLPDRIGIAVRDRHYPCMFKWESNAPDYFFRIYRDDTPIADPGTLCYMVFNVYHYIRFQVRGTTLRAKYWRAGYSEPDWMVTDTDETYNVQGPVEFFCYSRPSSSSSRVSAKLDVIYAGTGASSCALTKPTHRGQLKVRGLTQPLSLINPEDGMWPIIRVVKPPNILVADLVEPNMVGAEDAVRIQTPVGIKAWRYY